MIVDTRALPGTCVSMINYTERLTLLMQDIVSRVPTLSFIDIADVLVFARAGRSNAEGAFATCHCLTLPASEPGYYFWRDRTTHALITRRSEWFVTKSPMVTIGARDIKYMISFALPRFCDQSLDRSRKERFYPGAEPWMAKLDTVVHELYHIDPELAGHPPHRKGRRHLLGQLPRPSVLRAGGRDGAHVSRRRSRPPNVYEFLRDDFARARRAPRRRRRHQLPHVPVVSAALHRARSREQPPCEADAEDVKVEPLRDRRTSRRATREDDLHIRQFDSVTSRRLLRKGAFRAA